MIRGGQESTNPVIARPAFLIALSAERRQVPGTKLVVTRTAYSNNQSKYQVDGKNVTFTEASFLLVLERTVRGVGPGMRGGGGRGGEGRACDERRGIA